MLFWTPLTMVVPSKLYRNRGYAFRSAPLELNKKGASVNAVSPV
jgi:hypothetical protein